MTEKHSLQSERFKQAARELGTDDDPERFKALVRKIGTAKPSTSEVATPGPKGSTDRERKRSR
jgi:hypothetical protein